MRSNQFKHYFNEQKRSDKISEMWLTCEGVKLAVFSGTHCIIMELSSMLVCLLEVENNIHSSPKLGKDTMIVVCDKVILKGA